MIIDKKLTPERNNKISRYLIKVGKKIPFCDLTISKRGVPYLRVRPPYYKGVNIVYFGAKERRYFKVFRCPEGSGITKLKTHHDVIRFLSEFYDWKWERTDLWDEKWPKEWVDFQPPQR